jgi:hypothetical protein
MTLTAHPSRTGVGCGNRIPMSQLNDSQRDIATGTLYDRAECITGTAKAICYRIRKIHRRKRRKYLIHLAEDAFRILNAVCAQQVKCMAASLGFQGGSSQEGHYREGEQAGSWPLRALCGHLARTQHKEAQGEAASARTS